MYLEVTELLMTYWSERSEGIYAGTEKDLTGKM